MMEDRSPEPVRSVRRRRGQAPGTSLLDSRLKAKPGAEPSTRARYGWTRSGFSAEGGTLRDEQQATEDHRDHEHAAVLQQRWVAERAVFKDALKNDGGTEFVVTSIEFDAKIPEHVFSQAALRK
jgi:hypothetical protein